MPTAEEPIPGRDVRQQVEPGTLAAEPENTDQSVGELVGKITNDLQTLFRQELELAKVEIREDAMRSAKAAGMLGAAGFAGYMVAVLLSLAAVFGLGNLFGLGWSALIVAGAWAVAGGVFFATGRTRLRDVSVKPERTVESLKEDAAWPRHPTG